MSDLNNNPYEDTYYIIPRYIRKIPGITLAYLDVYETIFQFWNKNKNCFLSEDSLCERTGYKRRIIYKALEFFEIHNELKRIRKNGKRYLVRPERIIETDCSENIPTCTTVHANVHNRTRSTCTTVHHNIKKLNKEKNLKDLPVFEKTGNKKIRDYEQDERFMRFYSEYPRRTDPRDAWKAFKSIVGDDDQLLEQIIEDVKLRKQKHTKWQEKQFIKYPAVYLRKGEYLGEIFNAAEEQAEKRKKESEIAKERELKQEQASKQRAERERNNELQKQSDAVAYRFTAKQAPSQAASSALKGLSAHLRRV
jgi:hypothetical protein